MTNHLSDWFLLNLNLGFLQCLSYSGYYVYLESPVGISWAAVVGLPPLLFADAFQAGNDGRACLISLDTHLLGSHMQLNPGHAVFEKRKPAPLDGLVQNVLTAPLFVLMEVLFYLGYRPEIQERLEGTIEVRLANTDAKGA